MALDAEFLPIVAALSQRPPLDPATLDPVAYRATVEAARWPTRKVELPRVDELQVPGGAGPLRARLYAPRTDAVLPLVVFLHGGGFVICSIDTHDHYCRALAQASGCAVLSVDYRLAPEHRFPAAVEDAVSVVRWAGHHAAALGCAPDRLAIAGDSAGGNLALVAALTAGVPLQHVVLLYPALDPEEQGETWRTRADTPFLRSGMMRWFWDQYLGPDADLRDPRIAPLWSTTLHKLPQTTLILAEEDPLCSEGERLAELLSEARVDVSCRLYVGVPHGFATLVGLVGKAEQALEYASSRLRAALHT